MITPQQEIYYEKLREKKRQDYRQLNRQSLVYPEVIFLGDSITEWFPLQQLLTTNKAWANRGIAALNSQHLLDHLEDHVFGFSLTEVVLLIGTNDIGYGLKTKTSLANVRAIIEQLQLDYPSLEVYLLEVLPVNESVTYQQTVDNRTNAAIQDLNAAYGQLAAELPDVHLVKTYSAFLDSDGQLDPAYTTDGLHLSEQGYQQLASLINQIL